MCITEMNEKVLYGIYKSLYKFEILKHLTSKLFLSNTHLQRCNISDSGLCVIIKLRYFIILLGIERVK